LKPEEFQVVPARDGIISPAQQQGRLVAAPQPERARQRRPWRVTQRRP
jgi:hypothetical protein